MSGKQNQVTTLLRTEKNIRHWYLHTLIYHQYELCHLRQAGNLLNLCVIRKNQWASLDNKFMTVNS
jgi:hypothetical protein